MLFALLAGGKTQTGWQTTKLTPSELNNDIEYIPSTGTVNPGPGQKVRISLNPDPGEHANTTIINQYGTFANDPQRSAQRWSGRWSNRPSLQLRRPSPGLHHHRHLSDRDPLPLRSPPTPRTSSRDFPVCFGPPDYYASTLSAANQSLVSGCPSACTEDPAFHGNPVTVLTGDNVSVTWPAPGVYHIRHITTDQYGATQQSNEDVTVSGPGPDVPFSAIPDFRSPAVIGPINNGDMVTLNGCIQSIDMPYCQSPGTLEWGDGTTETQSAQNDTSSSLTFHFGEHRRPLVPVAVHPPRTPTPCPYTGVSSCAENDRHDGR